MADEQTPEAEAETDAPAELNESTKILADAGFGVVEGWPANHRLRAEAILKEGLSSDPTGAVTDEFIASTKERLAAEAKDAASNPVPEGPPVVKASMRKDALADIARAEGVAIEEGDTNQQMVDKITAARAAKNEG